MTRSSLSLDRYETMCTLLLSVTMLLVITRLASSICRTRTVLHTRGPACPIESDWSNGVVLYYLNASNASRICHIILNWNRCSGRLSSALGVDCIILGMNPSAGVPKIVPLLVPNDNPVGKSDGFQLSYWLLRNH